MLLTENRTGPLALQMTLLSQLAGASIQPDLNCPYPSTRCTFSNFTTLGLCRNYSDVTDISNRTCKVYAYPLDAFKDISPPPPSNYINCTYSVNGVTTSRSLSINFGGSSGYEFDGFRSILDVIDPEESVKLQEPFDIARMFTIRVDDGVKNNDFLEDTSLPIPTAHVAMANWYWCEHSYKNVSVSHLDGKISGMTNASTAPVLVSIVDFSTSIPTWIFASSVTNRTYYSNFLNPQFMDHFFLIDTKHSQFLNPDMLGTLVSQTYTGGNANQKDNEQYITDMFGMASFMSTVNMSELTQNVATAVTNQALQSADNVNFTSTPGTAYVNAAFYRVQWAWLMLPLLEAVATAVLLGVTIWLNGLPLLKSSNIALLAHSPEDAVDFRVDGVETTEKWEKLGDGFEVMLMKDEKGWMRLTRT
jgi:hypothetical protein